MNNVGTYYLQPRSEVARYISGTPKRILDVGCAAGEFRRNISWECEYWGVEPVAEAAKLAETNLDNVLCGRYEDVADKLPENYFDLVICNDVIEHMADPWHFLRNIRGKLAPGGQLVGSVPNVRYIFNLMAMLILRDWKYKAKGIRDRTHLRFFTKKSIRRMLCEEGFDIERLRPLVPGCYAWLRISAGILVFPLGGYDTMFLQIAFRARKPNTPR